MQSDSIFETLSPTRLFLRCALPSMLSMAVTSLYTVADGIFVGRYVGAEALAAINLVMPIILMSFALSDLVAVGSSVQISIRLGAKDPGEANRIFTCCSLLIFSISCVLGAAGWFLAEPAMTLMGADPAVTALAAEYLRVYAVCAPGVMIFYALDNYLRICGKMRYSMVLNVGTALLNIVLDFWFLVVLDKGVGAAALASCISMMVGTALSLLPFCTGKLTLSFVRGRLKPALLGNILANGSSEFFSSIASSIMMVLLNSALLRLSGAMAVAAFSIVLYVDSVVSSLLYGMADALQPAISYNYGAGNRPRTLAIEKRVLLCSAAVSLGAMVWMLLNGDGLITLFVREDDPALLEMSLRAMNFFSLSYLTGWLAASLSSLLTALNRPGKSLLLALSRALIFPLLCLAVLPRLLQLDGIWLTPAAAGVFTAVLALALLIKVFRPRKAGETAAS